MKKLLIVLMLVAPYMQVQAQTVPSYVDTNGLRAWYPFSNNAVDSSGNGNNLTTIGSLTYSTDRFGHANSAAYFDSTGNYFSISSPNLPSGDSDRSVSLWYNQFAEGATNQGLFQIYGGATAPCNTSFVLYLQDTSGYYFAGRCDDRSWDTTRTLNAWTHLVLVYHSDTIYLYRNDTLVNDTAMPSYYALSPLSTSLFQFIIGNGISTGSTPDQPYYGKIDDYGFWSRALSQCEIAKLYYATNNLIVSQPVNDTTISGGSATYTITDTGGTATYQWQQNSGSGFVNLTSTAPYSGVTSKVLTISPVSLSMNGYTYRCVRNGGACVDTSNHAALTVNSSTGITNAVPATFSVAPNPTQNSITISASVRIETVVITDLLGQTVLSVKANDNKLQVDLTGLSSGMFIIKINGMAIQKIVKE